MSLMYTYQKEKVMYYYLRYLSMFISERRQGNHWLPNSLLESRMLV